MQGFYTDVSADRYHADLLAPKPSLSSSIAKVLIDKTPLHAWTAHPRLNPAFEPRENDKFNLGTVAHEIVLGKGGGFIPLDFDNWMTKASKEAKQAVYDSGKTPLLQKDFEAAQAMASAVSGRLGSMGVFLGKNKNECVFIWQEGDVWLRSMIDSFDPERHAIYDLKTTKAGLSDDALARTIVNLSYEVSAAFYMRGAETVFPDMKGKMRFYWIFVEVDPPHELRIIEADITELGIGAKKVEHAIGVWSECMSKDKWPGYPPFVTRLKYPSWAEEQWLRREMGEADF